MKKLSILIPTIKRDEVKFRSLINELYRQILPFYSDHVEIICDYDENDTIGAKRQRLLEKANGKYIAFIDSDDWVSENYIRLLIEGIDKDVDCCSLLGIITTDGCDPHYFEHSIKYDKYETVHSAVFNNGDIRYLRFPNHLSCIRSSIAKQFKFPNSSWSEDTDFATKIHNSGMIKTEHYIPEVIYHYLYKSKK